MFKKLLIHTRRSIKLIILISLAVLLILGCIASFYKISYSVTLNGDLRQDENNLKDENDAYEIALKLIKKRLKEEYRR